MERKNFTTAKTLVVVALLGFWLLPLPGNAQASCTVSIGATSYASIQAAVTAAAATNTIKLGGDCSEHVVIDSDKARITLDGSGSPAATLTGPDPTRATLRIVGSGITVTGFGAIGGGENAIVVNRAGTAIITNNTITGAGSNGILVDEGASARIGWASANDPSPSPNTIQGNTNRGISVNRGSSVRIVGNIISDNGNDGIGVFRVSQADIAGNQIDGNAGDGISVSQNAGVNLGNDTGGTFFDVPNSTTVNNLGFGITCSVNSSVDNRLGSLNGNSGVKSITSGCTDSLIP